VLISGEGTNLQALIDAPDVDVAGVVSSRAGARGLERAAAAGIPVLATADEAETTAFLDDCGVELVVLAGYMQLLTPPFLDRFPDRIVNVHPSLLPAFPGARPIDDALAAGVETTGVTVHYVDEGLDTGDVIRQEPLPIEPRETLEERIHAVEHRLLPEVVKELCLVR
jgi:phosphoribosylglycinamide formyltransferase 1